MTVETGSVCVEPEQLNQLFFLHKQNPFLLYLSLRFNIFYKFKIM